MGLPGRAEGASGADGSRAAEIFHLEMERPSGGAVVRVIPRLEWHYGGAGFRVRVLGGSHPSCCQAQSRDVRAEQRGWARGRFPPAVRIQPERLIEGLALWGMLPAPGSAGRM